MRVYVCVCMRGGLGGGFIIYKAVRCYACLMTYLVIISEDAEVVELGWRGRVGGLDGAGARVAAGRSV